VDIQAAFVITPCKKMYIVSREITFYLSLAVDMQVAFIITPCKEVHQFC
jgi:hypothetical protein